MRPSSRRRVAAWLLSLPAGSGGEECARRGRLEMISFWLLCWKLLRATAGLRRNAGELTDGNQDDGNQDGGYPSNSLPVNSSPPPTHSAEPVAMETRAPPTLPPAESETHVLIGCRDKDAEELHFPEGSGAREAMSGEQEGGRGGDGKEEEKKEGVEKEVGMEGGVEEGVEEEEDGQRGEEPEGGGTEEEVVAPDTSPLLLSPAMLEKSQGQHKGDDPSNAHPSNAHPSDAHPSDAHASNGPLDSGHPSDGGQPRDCHLSDSHPSNGGYPSNGPLDDSPLNDGHLDGGHLDGGHLDDGHLDDGHLSDSQLSDCLQAELAMVTSSDSETGEDQWESSTPRDITDQEVGVICSSEREAGEGEEEERGRMGEQSEYREMKTEREEEEKVMQEQREEMEEEVQRRPARDVTLLSPSISSSASSSDTDRKESCSENVFTEHLDFLLARQQWRKMEEEVKGKPLPQPSGRSQAGVQGTHSSMYPPTRSPRIQRREVPQPPSRETPLSSTLSPGSEDSGLDEASYGGPPDGPESAVEREIRLTLEREERHRRERGRLALPRPVILQTGRSPPRPPACRTPTLSISPLPLSPTPTPIPLSVSPSSLPRSVYHELTANNVIILEPDSAHSRSRLLSPGGFSDWSLDPDAVPSTDVIVVETANLIIRSASEFCLSSVPVVAETRESTFSSNPFFKLRSLSSQSLVEQEIRLVRQREEEWRRQREEEWRRRRGGAEWRGGREKERFNTVLVSPGLNDNITFNVTEVPDRCVSSPSSPSRTRKMERSSMSCDHKFPPALSMLPRRQNAMAQRWEANLLANQKKE